MEVVVAAVVGSKVGVRTERVVVDNANVDCNCYWDDDELDNETKVDVERVVVEIVMMLTRTRCYEVASVDDSTMDTIVLPA